MKTTLPVTHLPKVARNAARSFVKSHADFDIWLATNHPGVASRDVTNGTIIDAARSLGIEVELAALIDRECDAAMNAGRSAPVAPASPVAPVAPVKEDTATMTAETVATILSAPVAPERIEEDCDKIFAPLRALLGDLAPRLRDELMANARPFVEGFHKPAIEITKTVEKVVTIETPALAPLAPGALPYATKTARRVKLSSLFKGMKKHGDMEVTLWDALDAPPVDADYVPHAETIADAATAVDDGINCWLAGPAATGKTTLPQELAARMGRPFVCISFSKHADATDLIGSKDLAGGNSTWSDGVLLAAVRRPGTIVLLDEITACPPGIAMILQGLTSSHRSFTVHATGERVVAAPGVVFFAADNTKGFGDDTGSYHGTQAANAALVSRFERMIEMNYLPPGEEARAIANRTGLPAAAARMIADVFAKARKLPGLEGIPLSLRGAIGFARSTQRGFDCSHSWETTVLNRIPDTERAAVLTAIKAHFVESAYVDALRNAGVTVAAGAPDSEAARAFDDEITAALNR